MMKQSDLIRKMESYAFMTQNPDDEEMWAVPLAMVKKCVTQLEAENEVLRNDKEAIAKEFGPIGAPEVRRAWAGEMMRQGREVPVEKLSWARLPDQDKKLDGIIASAIVLDFLVWFFAHPHDADALLQDSPKERKLSDTPCSP